MPKAEESHVIVELTRHTFHAMRVAGGAVEASGDCLLENKASLETVLDAVAPGWKTEVVRASAAVWPDDAAWHLSTDTEAMLDRTGDALRAIAASIQGDFSGTLAYAACGAGDGGAVTADGTDPWVMASAPADSLSRVTATLGQLKIVSDGVVPAAFPRIAAISAALRAAGTGSVTLWDIGTQQSQLVLVTGSGVEGTAPCEIGLEAIFEAIQQALRLKFRGAGERLFFNETYDFTEAGPKIAAALGPRFKAAFAQLSAPGGAPQLSCMGLTSRQGWFPREVAAGTGTAPWEPEGAKVAECLGLKIADGAGASFSAASLGLLGQASLLLKGSGAWQPAWVTAEVVAEVVAEEPPPETAPVAEPQPAPEPAAKPAPSPSRVKPSLSADPGASPAPFVQKPPTRPPVVPKPAAAPSPGVTFKPTATPATAMPSAPASLRPAAATRPPVPMARPGAAHPQEASPPSFSQPSFPAPGGAGPAAAAPSPSFPAPGTSFPVPDAGAATSLPPPPTPSTPGAKAAAAAMPAPAVTALPFEAAKIKAAAPPAAAEVPSTEAQPAKSKVGFYVGIGVAAALVFAGIAVVVDAHLEKIKAYDLEQQEALAHHVAEQRLKEAEESAKEEDERHHKELETAVEITRKQTEEETRRQVMVEVEAERLAKLPGALVIATAPAGASVSIDGAAPFVSPLKLDAISPGTHRIRITLAGREPVEMTADIKGSKTTDLGTVALESSLGALDLSSIPRGLEFAIRPSGDPIAKPIRTGRTPATLDDLPHGAYVVTFSRPGCRDHVEKSTVEKGGHASVSTTYADGSLELTSDPSGAWVDKDGIRLGTTPLTLHDLTPKTAQFELTLPGYDPTPVTCDIPEGQTLKVEAQLLRRDRIFKASEVKTVPVSIDSPQPSLSAAQRKMGAEVTLSLVVRRDGSVSDVEVKSATDDDIARRCKTAVEGWRFQPATAPDGRSVDARIDVPFKFPAQG
jgi:TonB family protein